MTSDTLQNYSAKQMNLLRRFFWRNNTFQINASDGCGFWTAMSSGRKKVVHLILFDEAL